MKVTFATICLNEAKYIEANLRQHYDFCDQWIIVEGACRQYPVRNVTEAGLSSDGTSSVLFDFPDPDQKLTYIRHGWTKASGEDAKSELRNRYAEIMQSGITIVIDADEFYLREDMKCIIERMQSERYPCWRIPQVHFWKSHEQIITGGYWDVPHNRVYHWQKGLRYKRNHNHPETGGGVFLHASDTRRYLRTERALIEVGGGVKHSGPCVYHFGNCKPPQHVHDKNQFYVERGEDKTRPQTTRCRAAFFDNQIPDECSIHDWKGPLPESFSRETQHA